MKRGCPRTIICKIIKETDINWGRNRAGNSVRCHGQTRERSTRGLDVGPTCQIENLHRRIPGSILNEMQGKQLEKQGGAPGYPMMMRVHDGASRITSFTSAVKCRQPCISAGHGGGMEGAVGRGRTEEGRGSEPETQGDGTERLRARR